MTESMNKANLPCPRCEHSTAHSLAYSEESIILIPTADGYEEDEPAGYYLFRCDGCTQISLYISSNLHSPEAEFGERVYPQIEASLADDLVPSAVRSAWRQAENVLSHAPNAHADGATYAGSDCETARY